MKILIIILITATIIVGLGCYLVLWLNKKSALNAMHQSLTKEIEETRKKYQIEQEKYNILEQTIEESKSQIAELDKSVAMAKFTKNATIANVIEQEEKSNCLSKQIAEYQEKLQSIISSWDSILEKESERLHNSLQTATENYNQNYLQMMADCAITYKEQITKKEEEIKELDIQIEDKQKLIDAIVKAQSRSKEDEDYNFAHRLQLSEEDLNEVKKIKQICPYLRNPEVLYKIIWTSYYQKPYQDLMGRLFKKDKVCGVYAITSLVDGKKYIGQSVDCKRRASEHIKRGLGAEPATRNKLYPEMKKVGVENFIFEILEEVPQNKLNEREKFYIQLYHTDVIGLNATGGNS